MDLVCNRCNQTKPEEEFYNNKKHSARNYKSYSCKKCDYIRNKELYELNRERYSKRNNDRNRKRKTGFTPELYEELLKLQDYKCAICGTDKSGGAGTWQADHCHDTKKPRGLLCWHCNVALGLFKDNTESLQSAIDYLNKHTKE